MRMSNGCVFAVLLLSVLSAAVLALIMIGVFK